ncbi:nucleotidyltransferase [Microlunatus lacustris]
MATDEPASDVRSGLHHLDDGLDSHGRIRREGDLRRLDPAFRPVAAATETGLRSLLGQRLHSLYLYGSVPRGTAVLGRSDLDVTVVLQDDPVDADRASVEQLATDLDQQTDVVDGVGITVDGRRRYLSPSQRHDGAFHISCLCTPLWGPDLADELPEQYPTVELARGIASGTAGAFRRLGAALADPNAARRDLARQRIGRRIARLAFACVLFRWPGWTSDPTVLAEVVKAYHPERADELDRCLRLGWGRLADRPPTTPEDQQDAVDLLATSAPWWLAEHRRSTAG